MTTQDLAIPLAICIAVNVVVWALVMHLHLLP
jgi:hypothetical protein